MSTEITEAEARMMMSAIERRHQQVVAEIDVPWWYWAGLAAGWVALGALAAYGSAWAAVAGTVAFGAAHGAVSRWVLSGRRASNRLSVRRDVVSRFIPLAVIGFLVVLTFLTVGLALIANADGARDPGMLACVVVAALVLSGGPALMAAFRRRAERRTLST